MGYALPQIKDEPVNFDVLVATRPNPSLYLIQFRRNIKNTFGNVVPITNQKGKWEGHGSYENERDMLIEFAKVCRRPNVLSGLYTFRCVWPDGKTKESEVTLGCVN